jgi:hypothetical protein
MGAHRFFDNEQIPRTTLYEAVSTALQAVAAPTGRLYVLHDLSPLDYSKHTRKKDRTQVGNEYGLGYELYTALILDAKGQVLGPCLYELRTAKGVLSSSHWASLPYTDHYEQVERGTRAARVLFPGRELVQVGDREFDELEWQRWLGAHDEKFIDVHLHSLIVEPGMVDEIFEHSGSSSQFIGRLLQAGPQLVERIARQIS